MTRAWPRFSAATLHPANRDTLFCLLAGSEPPECHLPLGMAACLAPRSHFLFVLRNI